jgi:hypothetical protein
LAGEELVGEELTEEELIGEELAREELLGAPRRSSGKSSLGRQGGAWGGAHVRERKKRGRRERWVRYGGRRERLDPHDPLPANQKPPLKMP